MIITYPLNGITYSAEDAETYLSSRKSGVFAEEITFTPSGFEITVSPFLAWIQNAKFKGKSVAVTEPVTLTISPAEAVLPRIDRIVLRFSAAENSSSLIVLKGIPTYDENVRPEITRSELIYDLSLARVAVKPGATELSWSDITSEILDEDACGLMRDGVLGIPTAQLQAQVDDLLEHLYAEIESVESNSAYLFKNGSVPMEGDFDNGGFRMTNVADPAEDGDAINKGYADEKFLVFEKDSNLFYGTGIDSYYMPNDQVDPINFPKAWLNPPLMPGTPYLTFEKRQECAVGQVFFDLGYLPNNGIKTYEIPGFDKDRHIVIEIIGTIIAVDNPTASSFPMISTDGSIMAIAYVNKNAQFAVKTFRDLSSWSGTVLLKYFIEADYIGD